MAELPVSDGGAAGDSAAVNGEIENLGRSGFALAMQLLSNRDDAADVVQDSFHKMVWKRRLFDPRRGEIKAWFLKIVRNRALDLLRRRSRRRTTSAPLGELVAASDPQPDAAAEKLELAQLVRKGLAQMPQDQREIVLLRDFHNLSYAEIAKVLDVPPGTVMSRLHRARAELRRRIRPGLS